MKQFYRLFISSENLISGTVNDGFFQISSCGLLPHKDGLKHYQFAVESFICANTVITAPTLLQIVNLPNINSYSTITGQQNQCALSFCTDSFNQLISHASIGHLLNDVNFLVSSQLHIKFTDNSGRTVTNMDDWSLSLVVYEVDE